MNQADSLAINISHNGNEVNFFQNRPRENGTKIDPPAKGCSQTDTSLTVDDPVEPSGSQLSLVENLEIPLASFASVSAVFKDGLSVSYSSSGPTGKPVNWDAESLLEDRKYGFTTSSGSPTPSRDAATPKGRSKSPKSKKKEKSDLSINVEPEPVEAEKEINYLDENPLQA